MSNVIRARVLLFLTYFAALPAFAQTIPALNDTTCAGQRSGLAGGLSPCTANDFTATPTFTSTSGITTCVHGGSFTVDLQVTLAHAAGNKRYNIGFFTGETGTTNPATTTSGNVCSAAAMPTSPAPWTSLDGNACGDMNGSGTATPTITGVKVSCDGVVGGNVQVPYLVVWDQNAGTATSCTGSIDVKATTGSKCNGGTAAITNVTVTPAADLSIVKNVSISGNAVTYTLLITNNGPDAANGATYSDTVPNTVSGIAATCGSPTGGAVCASPGVSGQAVSGAVPTLPNGGSVTITITGTAANNAVVDNTATVSPPAGTTDPTSNNNSSTATGTVGAPTADIGIQKSVAFSGTTVTYTLVVTNFGPSAADGASYTDTVPNTVSGIAATCGSETGSAVCGSQPGIAGQVVSGTVGTLPSGGTATITITGTAAHNAVVDNTASVQPPAGTNDTNNGNNSSTATGTVPPPSADVSVVKNVAISGNTVTYTLLISNAGPDAADGETYSDIVPATVIGVTPTCGSPTGGAACAAPGVSGQAVSGTVPTLPSGGSVTITIVGTAANNAVVDNTANILSPAGTTDPNSGNDSSTATGTVGGPVANVSMAKSVVISGNTVTYTLLIANAGPNSADVSSYTDNVPATVAISTATCGIPTGSAACGSQPIVSGQTVNGTVGTLPSGGSVTITITGTAANGAVVDNTASVAPPTGTTDPSNGNNSSSATGTVGSSADLTATKSVVTSGTGVTYTVTLTNNGPNAADGATYSDAVPATVALTGESCVPSGGAACGTPNVAGNTVSGTITTFPAGTSVTITISGTTTNGADISNSATVTPPGGTSDPNPGDNTGTVNGTGMPVRLESFDVSYAPQAKRSDTRLP